MTRAELAAAARIARRELRGGIRGFRIFLACLAIGVGALAAIGSVSFAIKGGLARDAKVILGGDVVASRIHRPIEPNLRAWVATHAAAVSEIVEFRAMAVRDDRAGRALVQLKAVDDAYPLHGALVLDPDVSLRAALADGGAAVEASLLDRLGASLGDRLRLGDAVVTIRATIAKEPDRAVDGFELGPRVIISTDTLAVTELVQPGSLATYEYRVTLPEAVSAAAWSEAFRAEARDAGWRIRDSSGATPGVSRFVERLSLFLTLVGLTALLVGGIGVGNAVSTYLGARTATIATLRCIGAPASVIRAAYLLLIGALAGGGIIIGLLLGAAAPFLVAWLVGPALPVPLALAIYAGPLALAALYGLLIALIFTFWPLGRAERTRPAVLFRASFDAPTGQPARWAATAVGALSLLLAVVVIAPSENPVFAAWFVAGALASLGLLRLLAMAVQFGARLSAGRGDPRLRLALRNLHRPGSQAPVLLVSLGLGLSVLVTVTLIERNIGAEIAARIPRVAPTFFFVDIQPNQRDEFERLLASTPGVSHVEDVPMLRGRIVALNGVAAEQTKVAPEVRWALDSDRGVTWSAEPPKDADIVLGDWWPRDYGGPPLVSFDANLARGMGLKLGDALTVNILGRDITARIANLRAIDWQRFGINFTLVFSPGLVSAAPHTLIATARATPEAESGVLRAVTDRFANVSAVRVADAVATFQRVVDGIAVAARVIGLVTLAVGSLVLAGAVLAGHARRVRDGAMLKVLGATRREVLAVLLWEYALIGLGAALLAAMIGVAAAYAVVVLVMQGQWVFLPSVIGGTIGLSLLVTLSFGLVAVWRALSTAIAPVLREI